MVATADLDRDWSSADKDERPQRPPDDDGAPAAHASLEARHGRCAGARSRGVGEPRQGVFVLNGSVGRSGVATTPRSARMIRHTPRSQSPDLNMRLARTPRQRRRLAATPDRLVCRAQVAAPRRPLWHAVRGDRCGCRTDSSSGEERARAVRRRVAMVRAPDGAWSAGRSSSSRAWRGAWADGRPGSSEAVADVLPAHVPRSRGPGPNGWPAAP